MEAASLTGAIAECSWPSWTSTTRLLLPPKLGTYHPRWILSRISRPISSLSHWTNNQRSLDCTPMQALARILKKCALYVLVLIKLVL